MGHQWERWLAGGVEVWGWGSGLGLADWGTLDGYIVQVLAEMGCIFKL